MNQSILQTKMKLVDASLGTPFDPKMHEAMGEYNSNTKTITVTQKGKTYAYPARAMTKSAQHLLNNIESSKLSRLAMNILNTENGGGITNQKVSASQKVLRDAFYNEVLLQSNMEKRLGKHADRDKLRHEIDTKGFSLSFNDSLKSLSKTAKHKGIEK